MTDKTLTIKIHTDLGDAVAAQNTLQKAIQGTGAALQQVSTTAKNFFNDVAWQTEYNHIIKVTGAVNDLKKAEEAIKNIRNSGGVIVTGLNTATIRGGSTAADLAAQFKQESTIATSALKDRLNTEQALRQNSGNTILQAQRAAASAEKAIYTKLAADILSIERDLTNGIITSANKAAQQRISLERAAVKDITAIRKAVEAQQAKVTARGDSAAVYRRETQEVQTELQRRLQLEQSIRINGANNVLTLAIRTSQEEARIMQNASRQILAIEQQLQSGIINNRGAANAMRAAILSRTEAQITSNRVVLEAAQLEQRNADAITAAANSHRNMVLRAAEFIGIYQVLNGVLGQVTTAMRGIPKVGIEMESTLASLSATVNGASFGESGGTGSVFKALTEEARRTGIEISTIRENFRTFQASASLAGESLKDVWKMFTDINTVSTALHLSTDKVQLTFLAISQIFNKTKVQSEELVKQLGNLLPGAFASFVQANKQAGESTQEASLRIIKAMKAGTVAAHETIKNFTSFYSERFAGAFALARSGLNANIGDMQTSFQLLGEAIYNLNSGPILAAVKGLSSMANGLTSLITASGELKSNLQGGVNIALGLFAGYIVGLITNSALVTQAIVGLKAAFISLNLYIDTTIVSLATLGPGMTSVAIATDVAAVAIRGFTAVLAFLASPILVIAGIAAIGKGIWDLQTAAKDTAKSIKEMNDTFDKMDAIKAAKKANDKQLEVNLLVEQDRLVIKAKENLINATERYQKLETSNRSLGIAQTKEEVEWQNKKLEAVKAYGQAVLTAIDSINAQKRAEEENAKSFENLQLGNTVGETDTKHAKEAEELRTLQDKYNRNTIDITNAQIAAQIKETERLSKAKVDRFKLEAELAEENFKLGKLTSQQLADTKIDLLEKEKAVLFQMSNEKAALQKKELTDTVNNVKAAYEAIRLIESSGGTNREPNISYKKDGSWNGTALGPGQMMITNLVRGTEVTPPFEPAVKDKILEFKTDIVKLQEWVEKNWIGLGDISEKYFYGLVDKFYKNTGSMEVAIRKAVQQYGEHTPKYMEDFERNYAIMNKNAEGAIKINDRVVASEQERYDTITRIAKAQVAVREELAKANAAADKAQLDSLDKMLAKTASAEEAYQTTIAKLTSLENQVNSKGEKFVSPSDSTAIREKAIKDFNIAKDKEISTPIEKAIPAVKRYEESLKKVNNTTKEFGSISNDIFSASLKGFSQLAGVTQRMVENQKNLTDRLQDSETKYQEAIAGVNASKYADPAQRAQDLFNLKEKHALTLRQYDEENLQNTLGGISQMMAATSQMFAENSTAAKAFNIIALAGLTAKAAAAILTQGEGDPYTAFARIAAMGSVVASILATAGAGGFNFSSGVSASSEQQVAIIKGTGTVLGDSTTASDSVNKTYELLKSIHAAEYAELRGINSGISSLVSNISGTVNSAFKGGSLQSIATDESRLSKSAENFKLVALSYAALVNPLGALATFALSKIPIIGDAINKYTNWVASGWFGKISHAIIGTGISTDATNVNNLLDGSGIGAKKFDVDQTTKSSWFKTSYKYDVIFSQLDKNISDSLNMVFDNIGATMLEVSKLLGNNTEEALRKYVIPGLTINLKGLSGEEASKQVNALLSSTMDNMAQAVFGGIVGQYQKLGEGILETAVRIVSEMAIVKDALSVSGLAITTNIIAISDAFVQAAGGLEQFQQQFNVFYDKFYSDAEKQSRLTENLRGQLSGIFSNETIKVLGQARESYRKVIEAIDINTISGQAQLSMLYSLAGAADTYYTSLETSQKTFLDNSTATLQAAYKAESDILQQTINRLETFAKALKDFRDQLVLGDTSILTPAQKYAESLNQYEVSKAVISAGPGNTDSSKTAYEAALNEITGKAQEFLNNSRIYNASSQQYTNDFNKVLQDISIGTTQTEAVKSNAEKQLEALNIQVSSLITINESVLSVKDAIINYLEVQQSNGVVGQITTGKYEATVALGRTLTPYESNWIEQQFAAGRSKEDIYAEASAYIKKQIDGSHYDGLESVPFDGYIAQLHKNERVQSASTVIRERETSQEIVAELRQLRKVVEQLQQDKIEQTGAIVQSLYDANERAAKTVVQGVKESSKDTTWSIKSKVELV